VGALPWSGYIHVFFSFGVTILSNLCVKRVDIFAALDHIFGVPVFGFFVSFSNSASKLRGQEACAGGKFTSYVCFGLHLVFPGVHLLHRTSSR